MATTDEQAAAKSLPLVYLLMLGGDGQASDTVFLSCAQSRLRKGAGRRIGTVARRAGSSVERGGSPMRSLMARKSRRCLTAQACGQALGVDPYLRKSFQTSHANARKQQCRGQRNLCSDGTAVGSVFACVSTFGTQEFVTSRVRSNVRPATHAFGNRKMLTALVELSARLHFSQCHKNTAHAIAMSPTAALCRNDRLH
jgi:hypothetical protein